MGWRVSKARLTGDGPPPANTRTEEKKKTNKSQYYLGDGTTRDTVTYICHSVTCATRCVLAPRVTHLHFSMATIKRTYSARSKSSSSSKRKDADAENSFPLVKKKPRLCASKQRETASSRGQKALTQLHFILESSVLRSCTVCGLSYTKGAPDDEALHRSHCGRVQRGMEWGKEEQRQSLKAGVTEVAANVRLKNGTCGRIICFPATVGGKIGSKVRLYGVLSNSLQSLIRCTCIVACKLARNDQPRTSLAVVDRIHSRLFKGLPLPCPFANEYT